MREGGEVARCLILPQRVPTKFADHHAVIHADASYMSRFSNEMALSLGFASHPYPELTALRCLIAFRKVRAWDMTLSAVKETKRRSLLLCFIKSSGRTTGGISARGLPPNILISMIN